MQAREVDAIAVFVDPGVLVKEVPVRYVTRCWREVQAATEQ